MFDNKESFERLVESLFMLLFIVQCYENGCILFICVNMSFALFIDKVVLSVMWIRMNENLNRMYHFEGRIARRDEYYILRDVSCVAMVTIIEGCIMRRESWMNRYVPHVSQTERHRVCITRSDMHHCTRHCILLRCTYLSLVNLILWFVDLVIALLWNLWFGILSLLLRICKVLL